MPPPSLEGDLTQPPPPRPAPVRAGTREPELPIISFDDGSEGASRWISRRDAARSSAAAARFADQRSSRRVDLSLGDDDYGDESRQIISYIQTGLASPRCSEIHGNGPDQIFAKYDGSYVAINGRFSSEEDYTRWVKETVERAEAVQTWQDVTANRRSVMQMSDGSSLTVLMPPFVESVHFSVRKRTIVSWQPQDLVNNGTMTRAMMDFLRTCVRSRVNMLIVGGMGSGKTSTLSILTHEFAADERVAVVEEVPEIQVSVPQAVYAVYQPMSPGHGLAEVLDSGLYMRLNRVIVGEIHMLGVAKMLEMMMIGSDGSMSTYHANSAEQAVERMRIGLQQEHANLSAATAVDMIRNAIELIVVLENVGGRHRCTEICEVDWRRNESGSVGMNRIFAFNRQVNGDGDWQSSPPEQEGRIRKKAQKYGEVMDQRWFPSAAFDRAGRRR